MKSPWVLGDEAEVFRAGRVEPAEGDVLQAVEVVLRRVLAAQLKENGGMKFKFYGKPF